jgi:hypothetical protein
MLWAIKALIFTVYAAIGVLLVLSFTALFARRWKVAVRRFVSAVLAVLLSIVAMPLLGAVYALVATPDHSDRAFSIGSALSNQLNVAVSGLPVGLLLGLGFVWLTGRRRRTKRRR